jgi:predicted CXXCH cytochrome family protein
MRRYTSSPRTDQVAVYWTSGHGKRLRELGDEKVATCVSCHGSHSVRAIDDLASPVYPLHVASTCGKCHSDKELMAGREYFGRLIGHDQVDRWKRSIHAHAMLEKGDMSAPTCNDCHGNHGALPPEVGSVANVCGTCHVKEGQLFSNTLMQHRFEEIDLPSCATCHNAHEISSPSDEMLGIGGNAVCTDCHERGQHGATLAGALAAISMRDGLENLKQQIATATEKLDQAERLGMEVREPRFHLREANNALQNSRTLVHTFALEPMKEMLEKGLQVTQEVEQKAEAAVEEHTNRRVWLGISLIPIFVVVGLLLLYIRSSSPPLEPVA